MARRHVVGPVASVPPGSRTTFKVGQRAIVVFNVDGTLYALRDICPHQGACLSGGALVRGDLRATEPGGYGFDGSRSYIRCPWHGWEYDLESGRSYFEPESNRVRSYDVCVEPGGELDGATLVADEATGRVPGPHTAETIAVSVEDDYIVVQV